VQENRSIFRHLPSVQDPQIYNRMLDLGSRYLDEEWDFRFLDLGDQVSVFWLSLVPTGSADQRWWEGSRTLLATMTFKVDLEDTMRLCIDSCFWPPSSHLAFSNSSAQTYIPQHFLPVCDTVGISIPIPPYFTDCADDQSHHVNGHYSTDDFTAQDDPPFDDIVSVTAAFVGTGVANVTVVLDKKNDVVHGHVEYDVTDHCQAGGTVTLTATDAGGGQGYCEFDISLFNDPPYVSAPDSLQALALLDTVTFQVTAADADADPLDPIELAGFWFEQDSLQPPTNPPSFDGGNPGVFLWAPQPSDTGAWICSFSAVDTCGEMGAAQTVILVELPPPPVVDCPEDQTYDANGYYYSYFQAASEIGTIEEIWCGFVGDGVENVWFDGSGLGTPDFEGAVEYDVTDYCQAGGTVTVIVADDLGYADTCTFNIILDNDPPAFELPDTFLALVPSGTMGMPVSVSDPEGEPIESIQLEGFWFEEDSLQAPTNSPSFDGQNPGEFLWEPVEADLGSWIALFSAQDVCGEAQTEDVVIRVGTVWCGDVNDDGKIDLGDGVFLIGYLYKDAVGPNPLCKGDATCDGVVDVGDVVHLLNYLFRVGLVPCFDCCVE
jgi:hypothetical protein